MLIIDQPITNCSQDGLERSSFARSLARAAVEYRENSSLVIGLDGPLGSGRSSLLNLICSELNTTSKYSLDSEKPIVIPFDAWYYSDRADLGTEILRQLAFSLGSSSYLPQAKPLCRQLTQYIALLNQMMQGYAENKTFNIHKTSSNYLPEIKAQLTASFERLKHKVVLLMDNIDRLTPFEIRQLLQTISCYANFPNCIYILAADSELLTATLNQVQEDNNQDFLDKTIHIKFQVPAPSAQLVENILLAGLRQILAHHNLHDITTNEWAKLYHTGFKHLFRNIRDVTKYLNMVNFVYSWMAIEANAIDLFAITALQLFLPNIYNDIRNNKDLFTNLLQEAHPDKGIFLAQEKERCDAIINQATIITPDQLRDLLLRLFPKLTIIYGDATINIKQQSEWRRQHRICDSDSFERFFTFSLPVAQLDENEAKAIIKRINEEEAFVTTIKNLVTDKNIFALFDLFENYIIPEIKRNNIATAILALLDSGDLFGQYEVNYKNIDFYQQLHQFCHELLQRHPNTEERGKILMHAITNCNLSLYMPLYEILRQEELLRHGDKVLRAKDVTLLKNSILTMINSWKQENRLIEHPHLAEILLAWKKGEQQSNKSKFILELIDGDENLIKFLLAFMRPSTNLFLQDLKRSSNWRLELNAINELVDLNTIEPRIGKIFEDSSKFRSLREREQLAILIFLDQLQEK